jgi:hypothetical protein
MNTPGEILNFSPTPLCLPLSLKAEESFLFSEAAVSCLSCLYSKCVHVFLSFFFHLFKQIITESEFVKKAFYEQKEEEGLDVQGFFMLYL